tara:strand:+ start:2144 stop:3205 length:1062 start_codon:yes stop_codon:yes gene_type:complete
MKIIAIVGPREEYLQCEILKGLGRMGVELITSSPLNTIKSLIANSGRGVDIGAGSIPINQPHYTDEEIVEHSKDADYIFVFWNKFPHREAKNPGGRMHLVDMINQPDKTVIIDGSEMSYTGYGRGSIWKDSKNYQKGSGVGDPWIWHYMRDRAKWYFKRETFIEDMQEHGIIPLPYPCRVEDRQEQFIGLPDEIFLTCVFGHLKTGLRAEVQKSCANFKSNPTFADSIFLHNPGSLIGRIKYLELVNRSKSVIDSWGAGSNCTVRRNEVVMNSTAIIGQKWEIVVPNDYTDGENIVNWETIDEFEEKVNYYFKNQDKLLEIGENGYQHALKYHTTEKRMEYIFDVINGRLKWE